VGRKIPPFIAGLFGLIRACFEEGGTVKAETIDPVLEPDPASGKEKKLLDQMRDQMRVKHYSLRTERSYCDWVERFIRFDSFAPARLASSPATPFTRCGARARRLRMRWAPFLPMSALLLSVRHPTFPCD
jgi:hypothetical protein